MNRFRPGRWLLFSAVGLCVFVALLRVFMQPMQIHGDCMEPAVRDGQWCFVNRLAYWHTAPASNDVILFRYDKKVWVSRVVAVGGQTVEMTRDGLVVDGHLRSNDPIARDWREWNQHGTCGVGSPFKVPDGQVYVLSDNLAARHDDSRVFGPIPAMDIVGKAIH